jgi:hypothetical protein
MPKRLYSAYNTPTPKPKQWDRHRREHHGRPKPLSQVWADVVNRDSEDEKDA